MVVDLNEKYTVKGDFPAPLGSALRVPSYSYPFFDIEGDETDLRKASDRAYEVEWGEGTPRQMEYVIEASKAAGLSSCSDILRDSQALVVYNILNLPRLESGRRINYTEPGGGVSTERVYDFLIKRGFDPNKLFTTVIEPSEERNAKTEAFFNELGLVIGKDFDIYTGTDIEVIPEHLDQGSQDIVAANGTLHHHAFWDHPYQLIFNLLNKGGFFANFDWFQCLCEHPARIYQALRNHDFKEPVVWETKKEDLNAYAEMFPQALGDYIKFPSADEMATRMITTFWLDGWAVVRAKAIANDSFDPRDDIFLHEAHGRPETMFELLDNIGFLQNTREISYIRNVSDFNGNPHQILTKEKMLELGMDEIYGDDIPPEGSNLLMACIAQKAWK